MNNINHTYGNLNKFNRSFFLLLSVFLIMAGLAYLFGFIKALLHNDLSASVFFWYFIGCAIWSPFVFLFISYIFSDVTVDDAGLYTTFLFRNLSVKWEDISEVKVSKPFGLRIGKKASVLVVKNGLTNFHRIYGLVYGQTSEPALLVWSNISNYDSLMKQIFKHRKKNKQSALAFANIGD